MSDHGHDHDDGSERPAPADMTRDEIIAELNTLTHTGYTCDRLGTKQAARDDARREALTAALDGDYTHDPASCTECQREREILRSHGHDAPHDPTGGDQA